MIAELLEEAEAGRPVYITELHRRFASLPVATSDRLVIAVDPLEGGSPRSWELRLPKFASAAPRERRFIEEYLHAEVYNILSSLGGRLATVYVDPSERSLFRLVDGLNETFCVDMPRTSRQGYGRAINVLDRMSEATRPDNPPFRFRVKDLSSLPAFPASARQEGDSLSLFQRCVEGLEGRAFCGIDVGGTDIKAVLVDDGTVVDYKEYDWFPSAFLRSRQLVGPILLVVRLLLARLWLHRTPLGEGRFSGPRARIAAALRREASDSEMECAFADLEAAGMGAWPHFDGIGLCFPDVVVGNKIVGGEVYKTRGIRDNPAIDYESDFAELTGLDGQLGGFVAPGGRVRIINDGPMASFTAAVEMAASSEADRVRKGIFAHTLGTELGTGWVTETGTIPDIPLEVYNFIIDLGSWKERVHEPDDLRSINNFNTSLPGTLQKYCSQSGVFRLAMKYFPEERPDLFRELEAKGFVEQRRAGGLTSFHVPTEPVDQRKAFLEHMMALPEREKDETNRRIWREIGEYLAVTFLETKRILDPGTDERFLFGRLVKNQVCFDLMLEGAQRLVPELRLVVAGSAMANTRLMKQLERNPEYSVAQFAQAIGAVYFANLG